MVARRLSGALSGSTAAGIKSAAKSVVKSVVKIVSKPRNDPDQMPLPAQKPERPAEPLTSLDGARDARFIDDDGRPLTEEKAEKAAIRLGYSSMEIEAASASDQERRGKVPTTLCPHCAKPFSANSAHLKPENLEKCRQRQARAAETAAANAEKAAVKVAAIAERRKEKEAASTKRSFAKRKGGSGATASDATASGGDAGGNVGGSAGGDLSSGHDPDAGAGVGLDAGAGVGLDAGASIGLDAGAGVGIDAPPAAPYAIEVSTVTGAAKSTLANKPDGTLVAATLVGQSFTTGSQIKTTWTVACGPCSNRVVGVVRNLSQGYLVQKQPSMHIVFVNTTTVQGMLAKDPSFSRSFQNMLGNKENKRVSARLFLPCLRAPPPSEHPHSLHVSPRHTSPPDMSSCSNPSWTPKKHSKRQSARWQSAKPKKSMTKDVMTRDRTLAFGELTRPLHAVRFVRVAP